LPLWLISPSIVPGGTVERITIRGDSIQETTSSTMDVSQAPFERDGVGTQAKTHLHLLTDR
jgi:hypothetical protein